MSKFLKKLWFLFCFSPILLFGTSKGNVASKVADVVNTQIEEAGKSFASIVNNVSLVVSLLWIVVALSMTFFAKEQLKQNAKLIFGAIVIIGAVYVISASIM